MKACSSSRLKPASRLLLVVAVPNDVGDVLVALLLLVDEGGVVHALVFDLDLFLGALGRLAFGRLLALGLRVRFLERDEFGLGGLRRRHLFFRRRRGSVAGAAAGSGRARALTVTSSRTVWHFGQTIGSLLR